MSKYVMKNETEFMFDETLTTGFTTVYNEILMDTRLSDSAIGLYCRIIRYRNIPDWIINQSTLEHENNKRTKVESAMKELIGADYIEKIQLRNEKGHMSGVKYIVHSKSKSFGSVDITNIQPNAEKPKSVKPKSDKPKSVNLQLKNKDNTNKDNTNKYSSSSKDESSAFDFLVKLFNGSISRLGSTTLPKFEAYVEKYDIAFIESVIAYCESKGAKTYSYFEKTIEAYISNNIITADDLEQSVKDFQEEKKSAKKRALASKDKKKKEAKEELAMESLAIDSMIGTSEGKKIDSKELQKLEDVNFIKESAKSLMPSEVSYNTWILGLDLRKNGDNIVAGCPNDFTKQMIESRYSFVLQQAIELNGLNQKLVVAIAE